MIKPWQQTAVGLMMLVGLGSIQSCTRPSEQGTSAGPVFEINFSERLASEPLDGRLLLLVANNDDREPRFQIGDGPQTQQVFGLDIEALKPGETAMLDASAFGYPVKNMAALPAGEYWVQALLNRYETFSRSDGHVIKLPMDQGEGQAWNRKPGNLYSMPQKLALDPGQERRYRIVLDNIIPPIPDPEDTDYIKHVRIQSPRLTEFWGRPMFLGAHILIPEGFEDNPDARYPLVINHGHFPYTFSGFRPEPPDPDLEPEYSARFDWEGYNRTAQEYAHQFYKDWTGPDFPRVLIIMIQHANPFYDDSYAVNSANVGPYGDAIQYELIPYIEKNFKGIGEGWARFTYGGSTGGWEALAVQVFYPDEYNGCFAACPDPIDFRAYGLVNIYEHSNAYFERGPWKQTLRAGHRNFLGEVSSTLMDMNHKELAFGNRGRSGDQWDIWQAVYSPVGSDGYPRPIWDKLTGDIDPETASYWKDNYDLRHILQRDWETLGPKLQGKIHVYCGDMDNYYLNNAVYLMEEFLENVSDPPYGGEVDYGDRAEHCWNGDHTRPNALSRLRYHQMFIPRIAERLRKTAPSEALSRWGSFWNLESAKKWLEPSNP